MFLTSDFEIGFSTKKPLESEVENIGFCSVFARRNSKSEVQKLTKLCCFWSDFWTSDFKCVSFLNFWLRFCFVSVLLTSKFPVLFKMFRNDTNMKSEVDIRNPFLKSEVKKPWFLSHIRAPTSEVRSSEFNRFSKSEVQNLGFCSKYGNPNLKSEVDIRNFWSQKLQTLVFVAYSETQIWSQKFRIETHFWSQKLQTLGFCRIFGNPNLKSEVENWNPFSKSEVQSLGFCPIFGNPNLKSEVENWNPFSKSQVENLGFRSIFGRRNSKSEVQKLTKLCLFLVRFLNFWLQMCFVSELVTSNLFRFWTSDFKICRFWTSDFKMFRNDTNMKSEVHIRNPFLKSEVKKPWFLSHIRAPKSEVRSSELKPIFEVRT